MKLVIYNDNQIVLKVFEHIENVEIEGNNVSWSTGSLKGVNQPFILIPDEVTFAELTDEVIALDVKSQHKKVDLAKENQNLKQAIAELTMLVSMGGM